MIKRLLLSLCLLFFVCQTAFAAFVDDFETGDFSLWSYTDATNGSATVQSTTKHSYGYAAKLSLTGAGAEGDEAYMAMAPGLSDLYCRMWIRLNSGFTMTNGHLPVVYFFEDDYSWMGDIYLWNGTAEYGITLESSDGVEAAADDALTDGVWHCLEFRFYIHASAGVLTVWVDGVQVANNTGDTLTNDATMSYLHIGPSCDIAGQTSAIDIYIDDVVVDSKYIRPRRVF